MISLDTVKTQLKALLKICIAIFYDSLALFSILACYTLPLVAINHGEAISPAHYGYRLSLLALFFAYFCCSWHWGGQTIGQRALGIRIKSLSGGLPSWSQCIRRCVFRLPAIILSPLAYGLFSINLSERLTHTRSHFTTQRYDITNIKILINAIEKTNRNNKMIH